MKKIHLLILSLLTLSSPFLYADVDVEDVGSQDLPPSEKQVDSNDPFQAQALVDYISDAKVRNCPRFGNLQVITSQLDVNGVYYYNPCYEEGLAAGVSYQWNRLDLQHNPFFEQKDINTASLILTGFTKRACDWKWTAQLSINFDNLKCWNFNHYMNYAMFVWGRYSYMQNVGVHLGLFARTGMKVDRVYPIIGVDWKINDSWMINAVFPMNVGVVYTINCQWSATLAARFFDQIHRVCKNQNVPMAVWHYQTTGIELGLIYNPFKWITANIHAGCTCGGILKMANRHYESPPRVRLRLDPAPYAGAQLVATF